MAEDLWVVQESLKIAKKVRKEDDRDGAVGIAKCVSPAGC
jgi:hypothetical protein